MRTRGRERGSGAAAGAHSAGLNRPAGWGQLAGAARALPAGGVSGPPGDLGCRRAHALGPAEETGETASPGESRPRARRILRRRQRGYGDGASRPEGDKKPPRPEAHVLRLWGGIGSGCGCQRSHGRGGSSLLTSRKLPGWPFTGLLPAPQSLGPRILPSPSHPRHLPRGAKWLPECLPSPPHSSWG